jgi:pimeloyl-ACP methyl ester carboxylesterase
MSASLGFLIGVVLGVFTAAVVGGEGERPVLLIHGVLNDAGEWALIAGKLSGRLVIPDWPGCGLSDAVPVRRPIGTTERS